MKKILKYNIFIFLFTAIIWSCDNEEFLNVENENAPNSEQALSSASDLLALLDGAANTAFSQIVDFQAVYTDIYADQITTTNNYRSFWAFGDQPRREFDNNPSNGDLSVFHENYTDFNVAVANANAVIRYIEIDGNQVIINDNDLSDKALAAAKFVKGIGLGYLGMLYDQAFIAAPDANPQTDAIAENLKPYSEVVEAAIDNIDQAIAIYQANPSIGFDSFTPTSLSNDEVIKLANSFAARFLINMPRTSAEAQSLDYNRIYNYANAGIDFDFEPTSLEDVFINVYQDWGLYVLSAGSSSQAGYLPADQKIFYLMQDGNSYEPDYYFGPNGEIQDPITSDDARLDLYYTYTTGLGYLNAQRNEQLLTNYFHTRYWDANNEFISGLPVQVFMKAENDLIKAECKGMTSAMGQAATIINSTPRTTVGGLPAVSGGMSEDELVDVLHYEYSVELDKASGVGVHWAFMRRHDLLQAGTPTQWPVPGTQLEILLLTPYTYGGAANAGEVGTASGANDWRN